MYNFTSTELKKRTSPKNHHHFCTTAERVYFIWLHTYSCYKGRWLPADVTANGTGHQHQKALSSSALTLILAS